MRITVKQKTVTSFPDCMEFWQAIIAAEFGRYASFYFSPNGPFYLATPVGFASERIKITISQRCSSLNRLPNEGIGFFPTVIL